jgi:hypothetical protein
MQSKASTVNEYLANLSDDRRAGIEAMRQAVIGGLDKGFEEGMQYGMIGYFVPHRLYPAGYHCDPKQPLPFAGIASQKNHLTIYFMHLYMNPDELQWFESEFAKTGKKLDMGKSCIRFKKLDDIPLDLLNRTVKRISADRYIELYEQTIRPKEASSKKVEIKKKATTQKAKKVANKATKKKTTKAAKKKKS